MYSMQYRVQLPADYDMEIIRERVRCTGHLMDGFSGLKFKAYCVQDKGQGAVENCYAPFYVWDSIEGMRAFCWGEPGYSSIVRDFGRHPIQDWTVHRVIRSPRPFTEARSLTMRTIPLPEGAAPSQVIEPLTTDFLSGGDNGTLCRLTAVDVTTWNLIQVELSQAKPDYTQPGVTTYEVLHVSTAQAQPGRSV